MKVIDFVEDIQDQTRGTAGQCDSLQVVVKLKDGTVLQVANVELTRNHLVIETEKW
jgi:hypothetical protein